MYKTKAKKGKSEGNKNIRKLLYNSNNLLSGNNPIIKTTYNNMSKPNNLKIINKKMANKREEILNSQNDNKPYVIFRKQELPPVYSQQNLNSGTSPRNSMNLGIYNAQDLQIRDREGLIVELYHVSNDMDIQNQELEYLKKDYNNLLNNCLTYKIMIEKILRLDENGNYIDLKNNEDNTSNEDNNVKKKEKSKSENNFKNVNKTIDEKEEYNPKELNTTSPKFKIGLTKKTNNKGNNESIFNTPKNKKKYIIKNINLNDKENNNIKINVLKRQMNEYNKMLIERQRNFIKIKNEQKAKKFEEIITLLNTKNNELESLIGQSQDYQYEKYETDSKIQFYSTRIKKYTDEIYSLGEKLKMNKNELQNTERDIESLTKLKEELKQKELKLYEEEKDKKNNIKEKKEEEDKIENMIKERKEFFEEKQKIDSEMFELKNKEDTQKKNIEKNNRIINGLQKENDQLLGEIDSYEENRSKLLEKADQPRKNRIKMKEMENEIKKLEKDLISYKVESDEKEKNMEEIEEKNNEQIKEQEEEINGHENIVKDLNTQINNLKDELKKLEDNKLKKEEELAKIEEDFKNKKEQSKIDKENLEKEKKEKELQENNQELLKNKENEEKDNAFLKSKEELTEEEEKLKNENSKIKEENEKLKELHKEKMSLYKLASEKKEKLNQILDEIKKMSA